MCILCTPSSNKKTDGAFCNRPAAASSASLSDSKLDYSVATDMIRLQVDCDVTIPSDTTN